MIGFVVTADFVFGLGFFVGAFAGGLAGYSLGVGR